ncbi:MAG: acyl-CoA dehydrogenase family protein [Myxococcota bacterium]|nr:acyl-CoA dehydrogenase family protein [Myxococcota bacterium]
MIDFAPSEEQELIVETVRQFARNEIRPHAREAGEARKLPGDVLAHAHELGLVANAVDEAFGGGGERSAVTGALVAEELAWGDLAIALAILSPALVALPIQDGGSDEQKSERLPRFTSDRFHPGSLALVEPRFDDDPFRPKTTATRDGDGYLLSGHKCFVPWLDGGDTVLVVASEGDGTQAFLVPRDAAGLEVEPEKNMGLDALPTVELRLDAVRVPASARLGGEAGVDLGALVHRSRVALSAMAVGVARAAFETARDYAKEREAFGAPIATKQAIAFKLADMAIEIDGARLLVWEAAWLLDQDEDAAHAAVLARQQASRVALEVTDGAVQVLGGHGYTREYLPEMQLRNARGFASFEALAMI